MRNPEEIISEILTERGIIEDKDIEEFLSEKPQKTYDPFLLADMRAGVDLLLSEIEKGSKICIYGDYDADGVTSVCVLLQGLGHLTDRLSYYIPSRFTEGYGLNVEALDRIRASGADMVVTVDCGCVSYREVEHAKSIGLKILVTDHHNIEDVMADCLVIDPKRKDNTYPFNGLAGCGVAFKLLQAVQRSTDMPKGVLTEVLDLVALGTVADIVPLKDENRTLVKYGIAAGNSGRRKSLTALKDAISLESINSENISFGLAPHINAAGRMERADMAVELLMSRDDGVIRENVDRLIHCNKERKAIQEKDYERCLKEIEDGDNFIVLRMENIHEGIAGITAGKLKDRVNRPVIITTPTGDGKLKGTCRSTEKVDIYKVLNNHSELFIRFGGHRSASGFLMNDEDFPVLKASMEDEIRKLMLEDDELFDKSLKYDIKAHPDELTADLVHSISRLEPFGEGNPEPRFLIEGIVPENVFFMGDEKNHVRFEAHGSKGSLSCVLFRRGGENRELLLSGKAVDITGRLTSQVWRGTERVQFMIDDIAEGEKRYEN
ncbi:MAG: single-stranded-DNA-specific exonuclease RecJ [Clostridiales bacterium]|nr:single-stranded-DNA-specific exonuclease RecJ [Clostridiales bacterium]MDD7035928.1 single-stranded-DNA-specific exonuclease RecJ [Bacillota bacterium]MDY2921147.1 single-stranded-DNA-specific exonuclease RecJ [Lentihominibacter sp.]